MKKNDISSMAPLLIFAIFTICVLSVLLTGADIYQKLSNRDQESLNHRTAAQYLTTRIRQSDMNGMISTGTLGNGSVETLCLQEEINGRFFNTHIYCYDGFLCELFSEAGLEFAPGDGQKILKMNDLAFSIQENSIELKITYPDFTQELLMLCLRNKKEVPL